MTLKFVVAPDAQEEVRAARRWLRGIDPETERRFVQRLEALLLELCESLPETISTGRPPQIDPKASLGMVRPVFQARFHTSRRKPPRRSNASTWRVFYALADTDGDRQPDVLQLLHVFHAASELPWERISDD